MNSNEERVLKIFGTYEELRKHLDQLPNKILKNIRLEYQINKVPEEIDKQQNDNGLEVSICLDSSYGSEIEYNMSDIETMDFPKYSDNKINPATPYLSGSDDILKSFPFLLLENVSQKCDLEFNDYAFLLQFKEKELKTLEKNNDFKLERSEKSIFISQRRDKDNLKLVKSLLNKAKQETVLRITNADFRPNYNLFSNTSFKKFLDAKYHGVNLGYHGKNKELYLSVPEEFPPSITKFDEIYKEIQQTWRYRFIKDPDPKGSKTVAKLRRSYINSKSIKLLEKEKRRNILFLNYVEFDNMESGLVVISNNNFDEHLLCKEVFVLDFLTLNLTNPNILTADFYKNVKTLAKSPASRFILRKNVFKTKLNDQSVLFFINIEYLGTILESFANIFNKYSCFNSANTKITLVSHPKISKSISENIKHLAPLWHITVKNICMIKNDFNIKYFEQIPNMLESILCGIIGLADNKRRASDKNPNPHLIQPNHRKKNSDVFPIIKNDIYPLPADNGISEAQGALSKIKIYCSVNMWNEIIFKNKSQSPEELGEITRSWISINKDYQIVNALRELFNCALTEINVYVNSTDLSKLNTEVVSYSLHYLELFELIEEKIRGGYKLSNDESKNFLGEPLILDDLVKRKLKENSRYLVVAKFSNGPVILPYLFIEIKK